MTAINRAVSAAGSAEKPGARRLTIFCRKAIHTPVMSNEMRRRTEQVLEKKRALFLGSVRT